MKKTHTVFVMLALLASALLQHRVQAQDGGTGWRHPENNNCFPVLPSARSNNQMNNRKAARPQSGFSNLGKTLTPQGTLKVLVIFAGFTQDINPAAPYYYDNATNPWPQDDGIHPLGLSFPKNANTDFYSNPASFLPSAIATATDHSLSNLYYQMSQHSANPFKIQAVFFPKRINVMASAAVNSGGGMFQYSTDVLSALKNDPDTPNFDFSQVDHRAGRSNYQTDNSALGSDHVIDYTVIVWRNTGSVFTIIPSVEYSGAAWADAGFIDQIPSANGQFYEIGSGFTQGGGLNGLN